MIEAVGWQYFPDFFAKCAELHPTRRRDVPAGDRDRRPRLYEQEKASRSFANKHIFPGGCLPSQALITRARRPPTGCPSSACEEIISTLRAHAGDLARALQRRLAARCAPLGYDERFSRLWNFYLALSEARLSRAPDPRPADGARQARLDAPTEAMAITYDTSGSGEPLVLIHGLGGSRRIWEPVFDRLAAERDVIAVDLPGFGESPRSPDGVPPTPANLGAAIAELCEELGLERPHVAGNSLGGWVALELAKAGQGGARSARSRRRASGGGRSGRGGFDTRGSARAAAAAVAAAAGARRGSARAAPAHTIVARPERLSARRGEGADLRLARRARLRRRQRARCARTCSSTPSWSRSRRRSPGAPRTGSSRPPRPERMPPGARYVELEGVGHTPTWDDPTADRRAAARARSRRRLSRSVPGAPRPARRRSRW